MFFCECDIIKFIWDDLVKIIQDKEDTSFSISNFEKMFGIYTKIVFLPIYFYVWNIIFMFVNFKTRNQLLLGTHPFEKQSGYWVLYC